MYLYSDGSGTVNEVLQDERLPLTVRKERIGKETFLSRKDKTKDLDCGLLMDTETIYLLTYGIAGVKLSRRSRTARKDRKQD